jgi:hypothetical protein
MQVVFIGDLDLPADAGSDSEGKEKKDYERGKEAVFHECSWEILKWFSEVRKIV